jgi:Zn-dependent protease with chaperone function
MRVGNLLIFGGVALVVIGVFVRLGWFSWFGKLPGDIRSEGDNVSVFFPITSMIVVSVVATLLLNLFDRFFRN